MVGVLRIAGDVEESTDAARGARVAPTSFRGLFGTEIAGAGDWMLLFGWSVEAVNAREDAERVFGPAAEAMGFVDEFHEGRAGVALHVYVGYGSVIGNVFEITNKPLCSRHGSRNCRFSCREQSA